MKKNILITGAAKRIGASCSRYLHGQGHNLLIHYHHSHDAAEQLCSDLNALRPNSAAIIQGDLMVMDDLERIVQAAIEQLGKVDVLINNASAFYPTPLIDANQQQWDELLGSNLKAPFFLAKLLTPSLSDSEGCIVNMVDIHAERGLPNYAIYSIAKAGLVAMTKILAKELGPKIRVNAIAPGAILWPEGEFSEQQKNEILQRVPLQCVGTPNDISKAMSFLINDAPYITGQILMVDGGRTLFN